MGLQNETLTPFYAGNEQDFVPLNLSFLTGKIKQWLMQTPRSTMGISLRADELSVKLASIYTWTGQLLRSPLISLMAWLISSHRNNHDLHIKE